MGHHIEQRLIKMRNEYVEDAASLAIVENMQAELDLHRRFGDVYSYVFYILRAS